MDGSMASIHIGLVEVQLSELGGKRKERMLHDGMEIGAKIDFLVILRGSMGCRRASSQSEYKPGRSYSDTIVKQKIIQSSYYPIVDGINTARFTSTSKDESLKRSMTKCWRLGALFSFCNPSPASHG